MKRTLVAAGLAIAVLTGGSLALILFLTHVPASTGSPEEAPPASDLPPAAPSPSPVVHPPEAPSAPRTAHGGRRPAPLPVPAPVVSARNRAFSDDPADPTPVADRVLRRAVRKHLLSAAVEPRLARCVGVTVFGGDERPRAVPRGPRTMLMLELVSRGAALEIVEARVKSWGGTSAAAVACARSVLVGQTIPVATSARAPRVRMPFPLDPRSEAMAAVP